MNDSPSFLLLHDLARLLRKHQPEAVALLSACMADVEFIEAIQKLLAAPSQSVANPPNPRGIDGSVVGSRGIRNKILLLEEQEPEKAQLLKELLDLMDSKKVLPSFREIQFFASDIGLISPFVSKNRSQATNRLLAELLEYSLDRVREIVESIRPTGNSESSRIEHWNRLIVDRTWRTKQGA